MVLVLVCDFAVVMEVNKYLIGGYFDAGVGQFSPEKTKAAEHFTIDDLLDFSNEDAIMTDGCFDNVAGTSTDSSTVTAVDSCNSSVSGSDHHFNGNIGSRSFDESRFSDDLCVPVGFIMLRIRLNFNSVRLRTYFSKFYTKIEMV